MTATIAPSATTARIAVPTYTAIGLYVGRYETAYASSEGVIYQLCAVARPLDL